MRRSAIALATAAGATLAFGAVAADAGAASAPPPPPTATGGQTVTQIAANLLTPTSFAVGGGTVFEGDGGSESSQIPNGGVFAIKGGTATMLTSGYKFVSGVAWRKGSLYVAGGLIGKKGISWQIQQWSGYNGTKFAKQKTIWTAPKGFDGTNGIAFAPNGRLLMGVDVGLTNNNDHGPASKTPLLYKIISMQANGKNVQTFASGMRQPWQMAFTKGSNAPYVSNLGQNGPKSVKNPPDEVLRVKQGDNYGFPKCNWTKGSPCKGYAKPFKLFPAHTNIMGMAIIGKRLYMTSFLSTTGVGPGGEVLSMSLKGGPVKPVVTGFVAPTVGLGTDGKSLYIGELTGQAFKVTP
jgi:glucose/arabinose dehydrogenase